MHTVLWRRIDADLFVHIQDQNKKRQLKTRTPKGDQTWECFQKFLIGEVGMTGSQQGVSLLLTPMELYFSKSQDDDETHQNWTKTFELLQPAESAFPILRVASLYDIRLLLA